MEFIDFVGGVSDNWVFLERIKLVKNTKKWQEDWIDWLSSATCVLSIFLNMFVKLRKVYNTAALEYKTQHKRDSIGGSESHE
jgi:competence transcription factor ComK